MIRVEYGLSELDSSGEPEYVLSELDSSGGPSSASILHCTLTNNIRLQNDIRLRNHADGIRREEGRHTSPITVFRASFRNHHPATCADKPGQGHYPIPIIVLP